MFQGCTVNWKPGKDTTTATVEKRQKHKKNGTIRTVTKTVKMNSFFNFFNPPSKYLLYTLNNL
jgi:nucleosome assembly protein 1-like 1